MYMAGFCGRSKFVLILPRWFRTSHTIRRYRRHDPWEDAVQYPGCLMSLWPQPHFPSILDFVIPRHSVISRPTMSPQIPALFKPSGSETNTMGRRWNPQYADGWENLWRCWPPYLQQRIQRSLHHDERKVYVRMQQWLLTRRQKNGGNFSQ